MPVSSPTVAQIVQIVLIVLAVLVYLGAAALQTRSKRRGLRVLGRIVTLVPFAFFTFAFAVTLIATFQGNTDGWSDLALAVITVFFMPAVFPTLYPLASVWMKPRLAWIVPAAFGAIATGLIWFALGRNSNADYYALFAVCAGALLLTALLTWFACFFRNPRCRPVIVEEPAA
jgi:hypothetical protein